MDFEYSALRQWEVNRTGFRADLESRACLMAWISSIQLPAIIHKLEGIFQFVGTWRVNRTGCRDRLENGSCLMAWDSSSPLSAMESQPGRLPDLS